MKRLSLLAPLAILFAATTASATLPAKKASAPPPAADAEEARPNLPWVEGPKDIDLGNELHVNLPAGYLFLGMPHAIEVMKGIGSFQHEGLLGVAVPVGNPSWLVVIRYSPEGYVKDDEKIDADEILKSFKEGTEANNAERAKQGFGPLHVTGWAEAPKYEKDRHRLVWALLGSSEHGAFVNFDTRILGRKGYVSVNLLTNPEHLADDRASAAVMLAATQFQPGARYEDFDKSKGDKVAEYGLAGLILGGAGLGAAKLVKVGLFAKLFKPLLLAGKGLIKLIAVGFAALVAGISKLFGRKKDDDLGPPPESPTASAGSSPPPTNPPAA